ncbi:MAG: hypothetical protein KDB53_07740 [Planctomycetes bacterium]|nr:hypothetical protein [Planctomycetota bacterium]
MSEIGNKPGDLRVFGVSGSNGKTTTAWLLHALLEAAGHRVGRFTDLGPQLGAGGADLGAPRSRGEAVRRALEGMAEDGCTMAVLEVSSQLLDDRAFAGLALDTAVVINLGAGRLEGHDRHESYLSAKLGLFDQLSTDGTLVVNLDDPHHTAFLERGGTERPLMTFSLRGHPDADLVGTVFGISLDGTELALRYRGEEQPLKSPMIGLHNVENVLAAVAAALASGIDLLAAARVVARFNGVPGRLEKIPVNAGFTVFRDRAQAPDAFERVLATMRALATRRLLVLFGCGSRQSDDERRGMGRIVECLADRVIVTSDRIDAEGTAAFMDEVRGGMIEPELVPMLADRTTAIRAILAEAKRGDVVLLAGTGPEFETTEKTESTVADDRDVVRAWRDERQERIEQAG